MTVEHDFDGDGDETATPVYVVPHSESFQVFDLFGRLLCTTGNVLSAVANGFFGFGQDCFRASNYRRYQEAVAIDRAKMASDLRAIEEGAWRDAPGN